MGVIRVAYLAMEHMSKLSGGRGGVIVNTASLAGKAHDVLHAYDFFFKQKKTAFFAFLWKKLYVIVSLLKKDIYDDIIWKVVQAVLILLLLVCTLVCVTIKPATLFIDT